MGLRYGPRAWRPHSIEIEIGIRIGIGIGIGTYGKAAASWIVAPETYTSTAKWYTFPFTRFPYTRMRGNPVFDRASGGWGRVRVRVRVGVRGYRGTRGPLGRQRSSERVRSFGRHFQKKVAHQSDQSDQSEIEIEIGIDGTRDSAWNVRVRTSITPTPPQRPRAHAPSQSSSHSGPPPRPLTA